MKERSDPLLIEAQFFRSLVNADVEALDRILADDFILIDVMKGAEITKLILQAAIASGQVKFATIEPADTRVRLYPNTAVVTGRTQMCGQVGDSPFTVSSRYTHVYVEQLDQWRLVTAQGTEIKRD